MPRRAVPARFMSNACSKNFADASGSSTMMAMCRSLLAILNLFRCPGDDDGAFAAPAQSSVMQDCRRPRNNEAGSSLQAPTNHVKLLYYVLSIASPDGTPLNAP